MDDPHHASTPDWQRPISGTSEKAPGPAGPQSPPEIALPEGCPAQIGRYGVEAILGRGAFGRVYRCHDGVLKRCVAVKVPHRHSLNSAELFLDEARVLAKLEHPAIVPVHDAGRTEDGMCYVVSKFIEGSDLKTRIRGAPLSHREAAELSATVADALHYAHLHGVVHRDLKPANILIDLQLRPYITDFGLAMREEDFGRHGRGAGTPAYMSPEQARSEGHLVDGRSDIFSLGVVFYELLTATRPFRGSSAEEVLERIRMLEARPPRQIDDTIPKELERICLKALSKRASDRYNTALDMSEDLRAFLAEFAEAAGSPASSSRGAVVPAPVPAAEPPASSAVGVDSDKPVKIVPKGLRSFDQSDADFFLKLLPGPVDRHGFPESIRFWKTRIEETDPESNFRVGIVYGPSGCGKSSLVKAGLLPCLDPSVVKVYVEAWGGETEDRLLRTLRRQLPGLGAEAGLVEVLATLRRGQRLAAGDKVLLVIDQFEQWLHAHGGETDAELVRALRQCDGIHVQCLLMVRDDFWLAVSRFMQALEVRLIEGENSRLVDLFDARHARKVLAALGNAFGAVPEAEAERSKEQNAFLDQAVGGLAQGGKVVSVRLSLFAEMVKGRPWTPATLREIGGAEGVGAAFLEETFSSPTAPPHHRLHEKTAQAILADLLPEEGSDIKGHVHSREELLKSSGCRNNPRQFDEVIALLDTELRLVTPTDPESLDAEAGSPPLAAREKKYQLTHDYLVPSLRTWLTRKQKATRQGRAELKLASLAALWTAKPEGRRLPSLLEFIEIRLYAPSRTWNEEQRKTMAAAARHHALRGLAIMVVAVLVAIGAWEFQRWYKADEVHRRLLVAKIDAVPATIDELSHYRTWVDPWLRQDEKKAEQDDDKNLRLLASLALLPSDESQVDYLFDRLIDNVAAGEADVIRQALQPHKARITEKLWNVATSSPIDQQCLSAAGALALYAPDDPRWTAAAAGIAARLARSNPFDATHYIDALVNVHHQLVGPVSDIARDPARSANQRLWATNILAARAPDRADLLVPVLLDGSHEQFVIICPLLTRLGAEPIGLLETELQRGARLDPTDPKNDAAAQRKARAAVALLRLGQPEKVWPLFKPSGDESVRSYLIHWSKPLEVDPQVFVRQLVNEKNAGVRSALLLLLGEYADDRRLAVRRQSLVKWLLIDFESAPDPGLHAAAQWLLQKWNCGNQLKAAIDRLGKSESQRRADRAADPRQWYVNREGQTFVIVDARRFAMGSPDDEPEREGNEAPHTRTIGRRFAIDATPVTNEQFQRFLRERPSVKEKMPPVSILRCDDCPQTGMNWYEAAEYCNWLSAKDGIAEDQWCYEPNAQHEFDAGMQVRDKYLALAGYRLPTEAEWEFACRAETATRFYFGQSDNLLVDYAWYYANSGNRARPVATQKPNDLGLFDMHGNVWQWCEWPAQKYPDPGGAVDDDSGLRRKVANDEQGAVRGGAYDNLPRRLRAACRGLSQPSARQESYGFRPVRTIDF